MRSFNNSRWSSRKKVFVVPGNPISQDVEVKEGQALDGGKENERNLPTDA